MLVIMLLVSSAQAGNISPGTTDTAATKKAGNLSPGVSDTATTASIPHPPHPPYPPQGSGGSTGGGGLVTDEPLENIEKLDRQEKDLKADRTTVYKFNTDVYELDIVGMENENDIMVKVEMLKSRSAKVLPPQGEIYRYVNIYAGTQRIKGAGIKFRVPLSWAQDKETFLARWNGGEWETLDTAEISRDGSNVYYQTSTKKFSNFAIVGAEKPTSAVAAATVTVAETAPIAQTVQPTETPMKVPGFAAAVTIIALAAAYARRKS